jgi:hypothetical protein
MKKLLSAAAAVLIILSVSVTSCKKYEEGPAISLLSKKARLTGDWQLESISVNGVDFTEDYKNAVGANFEWDIEKDGSYRIRGIAEDTGKWKLGEDKDDVYFTSDKAGSKEESFRILKLKSKSLWLRQTAPNGDVTILKLKQ